MNAAKVPLVITLRKRPSPGQRYTMAHHWFGACSKNRFYGLPRRKTFAFARGHYQASAGRTHS